MSSLCCVRDTVQGDRSGKVRPISARFGMQKSEPSAPRRYPSKNMEKTETRPVREGESSKFSVRVNNLTDPNTYT